MIEASQKLKKYSIILSDLHQNYQPSLSDAGGLLSNRPNDELDDIAWSLFNDYDQILSLPECTEWIRSEEWQKDNDKLSRREYWNDTPSDVSELLLLLSVMFAQERLCEGIVHSLLWDGTVVRWLRVLE